MIEPVASLDPAHAAVASTGRRPVLEALRRHHALVAGVLLFVLMAAVHREVVFQGRSFIHTNYSNPLDWRPLEDNYGPGFVPHAVWTAKGLWPFPNIRDPGATWWQWEPSTEFLKQAIADREWPFWDPYVAAGTPGMANLVQAFFFPPYLVLVAVGASAAAKNAYFLTLLWSAAFLTYLLLRRHDLGFIASLGGAIVVLVGGSMNQNLGAFAGQTVACLPLVLYATRCFLDRPGPWSAAWMALAYACASLASFPPILIGVFGVTALYAAVAILSGDSGAPRARTATLWVATTALAVGLVGFYYGPAFALRGDAPQVAMMYRNVALETIPFIKAYQLLSPTLMGGVQVYWNDPLFINGVAHIPYVGMVALLAAVLARPGSGRARTLYVTSAVASILILLKLFGVPPVQWISYLPSLNEIHFSHYLGVPLGFPLAFLAALGLDRICRGQTGRTAAAIAAIASLVVMETLWRAAETAGVFAGPTATYWSRDWKYLAIVTVTAATSVLFATLVMRATTRRVLVAIAVALIAAEGLYNNNYPRPKAWNLFEHPVPYIRSLQEAGAQGLMRTFSFGVPTANTNEAFGIFSLDSLMAFNAPRVWELYRRYATPPPQVFLREAGQMPPDPVLDRANIGVVGMYDAHTDYVRDAQSRGYVRRFDDGFFTLFRRPPTPRFLYSSEYRVVPPDTALEAVAAGPLREIVLENQPTTAASPNVTGDPDVRVVSYRRNSIVLELNAPRPGLVYASESYFDGWTATVNGAPARIFPANYAFRAVEVPSGPVRVEFHYWPPGLTSGLAATGVSVAILAGLFAVGARRRTRDGA